MYDVVSENPEADRKHLHENLLSHCVLNGDCSVRPPPDWRDADTTVIAPILENSVKWFFPPIEAMPMDSSSLEDEVIAVSPELQSGMRNLSVLILPWTPLGT